MIKAERADSPRQCDQSHAGVPAVCSTFAVMYVYLTTTSDASISALWSSPRGPLPTTAMLRTLSP